MILLNRITIPIWIITNLHERASEIILYVYSYFSYQYWDHFKLLSFSLHLFVNIKEDYFKMFKNLWHIFFGGQIWFRIKENNVTQTLIAISHSTFTWDSFHIWYLNSIYIYPFDVCFAIDIILFFVTVILTIICQWWRLGLIFVCQHHRCGCLPIPNEY